MYILRLAYLFVSVLVSVPSMSISNVVETQSEIHPVSVTFEQVRNLRLLYFPWIFILAFQEFKFKERILFSFELAVEYKLSNLEYK